jgi:transketolase
MRELAWGDDVLIVTSGITTEEAMRARSSLENAGVSVRHLHLNTIKPFNDKALLDHIGAVKHGVITLENHVTEGGIGSLTAEIMADNGVGKKLLRLGLKDTYAHGGSRAYLMRYYDLDALALVQGVEKLMDQKFGITEEDLDTARVEAVHSLVKAEGL